jgi:hypothetical protein
MFVKFSLLFRTFWNSTHLTAWSRSILGHWHKKLELQFAFVPIVNVIPGPISVLTALWPHTLQPLWEVGTHITVSWNMRTMNFLGSILTQVNKSSERQWHSFLRLYTYYNISAAIYKYAVNFVLSKVCSTNLILITLGNMILR